MCKPSTRAEDHDGPIMGENVGGLRHFICMACDASVSPSPFFAEAIEKFKEIIPYG